MKVLIADDDAVCRRLLQHGLDSARYELVTAEDGGQAMRILDSEEAPRLALLDWMMPGVDGVEICRRVRARDDADYVYVILVTSRERKADVVAGLRAGADDYLKKPYDLEELRCRVRAGERIVRLKSSLESKIAELGDALSHVRKLQGLLPICMHCKNIRDDANTWHSIESYIEKHSDALFTHSLCVRCLEKHYPDYADEPS